VWASAWHTPAAAHLIRIAAPAILLSSLAVIPIGLLRRRLRYASAAGIESVAPVLGFVAGAGFVLSLRSPSGLVLGQLSTAAIMLGAGVLAVRSELAVCFSAREAWGLLSFSGQITGQNLTHYSFYTLPGFVVARIGGSSALGFFSRANVLVLLPRQFLTMGISKALYPVIPQLRDDDTRRRALSDVVAVSTFAVWPLLAMLAGTANVVVDVLFGPGWRPAAAIVPPLCLFAGLNVVYTILASATESIGWLRTGWTIQGVWAAVLAVSTLLAWQLGVDVRTYLYVYAAAQLLIHLFQVRTLARRGLVSSRAIVRHELVGGAIALVAFGVSFAASDLFDGSSLPLRVAVSAGVGLAIGAGMLLALPRLPAGKVLAARGLLPAVLAPRHG
jgi:PST family polysaccharide transporter